MGLLEGLRAALSGPFASRQPDPRDPTTWEDEEPNWPARGGGASALYFPRPGDALDHLVEHFRQLDELERQLAGAERLSVVQTERYMARLGEYALGVRALQLEPAAMRVRRRTFGLLAQTLTEHLMRLPRLVVDTDLHDELDRLVESYFATGDRGLVPLGRDLGKALGRADERLRGALAQRRDRRRPGGGDGPARPWMSRRSNDLHPLQAYRMLLEDARPEQDERLLARVREVLEVAGPDHEALSREVAAEVESGRLRPPRGLDPRVAFERLYRLARSGRALSPESREVLSGVGRALGITQADFELIRQRVAAGGRGASSVDLREQVAEAAAPVDPARAPSDSRLRPSSGQHQRPGEEPGDETRGPERG